MRNLAALAESSLKRLSFTISCAVIFDMARNTEKRTGLDTEICGWCWDEILLPRPKMATETLPVGTSQGNRLRGHNDLASTWNPTPTSQRSDFLGPFFFYSVFFVGFNSGASGSSAPLSRAGIPRGRG